MNEPEDQRAELLVKTTSQTSLQSQPSRPGSRHLNTTSTASQLSLFSAYAIVVGGQIGSGIFSSPSQVDRNVPSPGAALLVWAMGGVLAWSGAASFAELGTAIPVNGGMQEYLGYIYGDFLASVQSFLWSVAVKPSAQAIVSITFAQYWTSNIIGADVSSPWLDKGIALLTLGGTFLMNSVSSNSSTNLTNFLLFTKLSTIGLLVVLAVLAITIGLNADGQGVSTDWKDRSWFSTFADRNPDVDWHAISTWELLGYYSTALYAGTWAYSGWDSANLVAGEIRNPSRNLPRSIHTGVATVIIAFLLANVCYYIILPWSSLRESNAVAVAVGQKTLGAAGGIIFAFLVSASCLGALNINVFTTGRLTDAAAQRRYLPSFLATPRRKQVAQADETADVGNTEIDEETVLITSTEYNLEHYDHANTPIRAMLLNVSCAAIFILVGTFGGLVTFVGLAEYFFYFLAVLGSIILRYTQPDLTRPYQPSIAMPLIFCSVSLVLVLRGIIFAPIQGSVLMGLIAVGAGSHVYKQRSWERWGIRRRRSSNESSREHVD
ncbi:hypothetical protein MMC25_000801 [Agyrium rufum]|nr:hypothetical protein [Agyrium rufum]